MTTICKFITITNFILSRHLISKFRLIGVPTRDSFSSRVLKVCNLSRVEAQYLKTKIVFSRSTITSPVRTRSFTSTGLRSIRARLGISPTWDKKYLQMVFITKAGFCVLGFYNCTFAQLSFCVHYLFVCHFTFVCNIMNHIKCIV